MRAQRNAEYRRIASEPKLAYEYVWRSSMMASLRPKDAATQWDDREWRAQETSDA